MNGRPGGMTTRPAAFPELRFPFRLDATMPDRPIRMRGAPLRRAWLTLLMAAQLVGVGVPLADAWLEAAVAGPVEIGAPADPSSESIHVDGACALCQHLDQQRSASTFRAQIAKSRVVRTRVASADTIGHDATPLPLERGRSPPMV